MCIRKGMSEAYLQVFCGEKTCHTLWNTFINKLCAVEINFLS